MTRYPAIFAALSLAGLLAAAPAAQAGGLYDNGYPGSYQSDDDLEGFCRMHPYDDACDNDDYSNDEPRYEKPHRRHSHRHHSRDNDGRCRALIRAVGKRNLIRGFARNSARFAWRREARAVHGSQYSNWRNARNFSISCTRHGALKSCVARGTPCRY